MTTYNTGNPLGSTDPRDLYDNAENLDYFTNGENLQYLDRLGVLRDSLAGIRAQSSYVSLGDYAAGLVFTARNQIMLKDGEFYAPAAATVLPYTTTGVWASESAKFVNRGDAVLRGDLAGADGADFVNWRGELGGDFLDAGWFQPRDLDLTGATDESAKVLAYLTAFKRVRLPATGAGQSIRLTSLTLPSGTALAGYGAKEWNGAAWTGVGTLIIGTLRFDNAVGCAASMLTVDNFAAAGNAVTGLGPDTAEHCLWRVNTRANNHGQLWEQNGADPNGDYGGNILVQDCKHWGGPNGFVSKMRSVQFVNCKSFDTTVQAFVIVSDNINGATTYSRASNTLLDNCYAEDGIAGIRIYSRDQFSLSNANGVAGVKNTRIRNFQHGAFSQFVIRIGDAASEAASGNFSRVLNADTFIDARLVGHTGAGAALYLEMVNRCWAQPFLSGNTSNFGAGDQVFALRRNEMYSDAAFKPQETLTRVNGLNSSVLDLTSRPKTIRFQNTSNTVISTVNGLTGADYVEFTCVIEENFTKLGFITGGVIYGKRGDSITIAYDGASFFVLAVRSIYADIEQSVTWASTLTLDFWAQRSHWLTSFPTAVTALIQLGNPTNLANGNTYQLRMGSGNGVSHNITAWSADFVFTAGIPAPVNVPATGGFLLTFKAIGSKLYVESRVNY